MIKASVIICTYNRGDTLLKTLENLDRIDLAPDITLEILIIDNNSTDNTKDIVEEYIHHARHYTRYIFEKNQGKSFALNRGVREANGEMIAFTDDDIIVRRDWILNIKKAFEDSGCSCVGGKILLRFGKTPPDWLSDKMMEQYGLLDLGDTAFLLTKPKLYGANFAVAKSVFGKHGDFDVNLGPKAEKMYNNEDVGFIEKLIKGGEKVLYSPEVVVEHIIPSQHMEKSYFRKRMFHQGEIKGFGEWKKASRSIAGIPLYLIKEFIATTFEYIYMKFTSPIEAFEKEINLAERMGFFIGRFKCQTSMLSGRKQAI